MDQNPYWLFDMASTQVAHRRARRCPPVLVPETRLAGLDESGEGRKDSKGQKAGDVFATGSETERVVVCGANF